MNFGKYIVLLIGLFCFLNTSAIDKIGYISGNVIIQLDDNKNIEAVIAVFEKKFHIKIDPKLLSESTNIWLLKFDENQTSTLEMVKNVKTTKHVNVAQVNHNNISKRGEIPNDPSFSNQWAHINDGSSGAVDADMDSEEAWQFATGGYTQNGDRIVVAVIDEGIDLNHNDLTLWVNKHEIPNNTIDDDNNGFIDDVNGYDFWDDDGNPNIAGSWESHGTHVAGIIGAKGNNCLGVVGVNWDVEIMAIRGSSSIESEVILAYDYALEMRKKYNRSNGDSGAYVVATNSSFGVDRANPNDYPLWCDFYDALGAAGILSAVAGPNLDINIDNEGDVPGACPSDYTICVTNTNKYDDRAYAGYGVINVDIGAPGSSIYSTVPGGGYGSKTGTSMATPQIAGAVALMQSAICKESLNDYQPDELALFIKNKMLNEGIDSVAHLNGEVNSCGRLNLYKCVTSVSANVNITVTEPTCNIADGEISIEAIGISVPFSYNWSNGTSSSSISGLNSGTYTLTTTDGNGCSTIKIISITDSPIVNNTITNPKCKGVNNGAIATEVLGSNSPYSYNWNNLETTSSITGLSSGAYSLTVTSNSGCISKTSYLLSDSLDASIISAIVQEDTCESSVGKIIVDIPSNDTYYYGKCYNATTSISLASPYTYTWSNGMTTDTIQNLTNGNYFLTITTNDGCNFESNYAVNSLIIAPLLNVYDTVMNLSCFESSNGWIRVDSVLGGNTPFSYQWSNNQTSSTIVGLQADSYELVITNSLGCVHFKNYTLTQPNNLTLALSTNQMSAKDANDGGISATLVGGTNPYSYAWSNAETTNSISDLSYGNYFVTVTDFYGCSTSKKATIDYISGINEYSDAIVINIFPNPTKGIFQVISNQVIQQINIYNYLGQAIIQENLTLQFDVSNYPSGIYFVELTTQFGSVERRKIVKQ